MKHNIKRKIKGIAKESFSISDSSAYPSVHIVEESDYFKCSVGVDSTSISELEDFKSQMTEEFSVNEFSMESMQMRMKVDFRIYD
jgi:hypothetical protein